MLLSCNELLKILAVILAAFAGHLFVYLAMRYLVGGNTGEKKTAAWLGILERGMYASALFLGYPQFIALWLGIKVLGEWKNRSGDFSGQFSRFLFGSGLSLSVAILVVLVVQNFIGTKSFLSFCSYSRLPFVHQVDSPSTGRYDYLIPR